MACEDFRSRENWFKQSTLATQFVGQYPLEEMTCQDELVNAEGAYCLAKTGEVYIVYLPAGTQNATLQVDTERPLSLEWFNPREGGEVRQGSITSLEGKGLKSLGHPPADPQKDWVVVVGTPEAG